MEFLHYFHKGNLEKLFTNVTPVVKTKNSLYLTASSVKQLL